MSTPIYDRLKQYHISGRISFAMPGHKNGAGLKRDLTVLDVTELPATLDLHSAYDEVINDAQSRLAELYGAEESFILTCGATAGIQAMLAAALNPGEVLLVSADCHMSVINTCALCGFKLRLIPSEIDRESLIAHDSMDIASILSQHDDIDAVLVTSPNYYGQCRNIEYFAKACHDRRIPLLVDEAHGAHFIASGDFPKTAVQCGADACVNSAHKTLNALTGAAYLHIRGELLERRKIRAALGMFQTSSPSYPIAASADIAREELEHPGNWKEMAQMCLNFRQMIREDIFVNIVENDDPTRLVLNFSMFDTDGFEIAAVLAEKYSIDVEMADMVNVVLIITPQNTEKELMHLYKALREICDGLAVRREPLEVLPPPAHIGVISPQRAFYAKPQRLAPEKCIGRMSALTVTAYPPGIPIICAGEEITPHHIIYIRHLKKIGAVFTSFDDGMFTVI